MIGERTSAGGIRSRDWRILWEFRMGKRVARDWSAMDFGLAFGLRAFIET